MFIYLATPYSNYPYGHEQAYRHACTEAAFLAAKGMPVFCPITHGHGLSEHGGLAFTGHALWEKIDRPFVDAAAAIVVCRMTGWQESSGIAHEIEAFEAADKPVFYMDPGVVPPGLLEFCGHG
jgi:hypothetical protein